jgi:hypothetical protein
MVGGTDLDERNVLGKTRAVARFESQTSVGIYQVVDRFCFTGCKRPASLEVVGSQYFDVGGEGVFIKGGHTGIGIRAAGGLLVTGEDRADDGQKKPGTGNDMEHKRFFC